MLYEKMSREEVDAMYENAKNLSALEGLPPTPPPTESCKACGRDWYGWCDCILPDV